MRRDWYGLASSGSPTTPDASCPAVMEFDVICAPVMVPAVMSAPSIGPVTVPALMAYGAAVIGWRGTSMVNAPEPLVRTPISNQRGEPSNTPAPKSSVTVNKPLLTLLAELVRDPPVFAPPLTAS